MALKTLTLLAFSALASANFVQLAVYTEAG
jgi:hypothetical protein